MKKLLISNEKFATMEKLVSGISILVKNSIKINDLRSGAKSLCRHFQEDAIGSPGIIISLT